MRRPLVTWVALISSAVLTVGPALPAVAAPPPAPAGVDADVDKILTGISQFAGLTEGLVDLDRLSAQLPLIELAPAAAAGLDLATLFEEGLYDKLAAGASDFASLNQIFTGESLSGGRQVTLTSTATTVGTDKVVDVLASFTKTVTGSNLFLADDNPKLSLRVAGGADVGLTLQTHLTFVLGNDTDFYVRKNGASPSFTLTAGASLASGADLDAALGILGINVSGSLTYAATILGSVDDPDGNGRLAFTEPGGGAGELAAEGAVDGLFSFTMPTGQGAANQASGTFNVTAEPLVGFTEPSPISATVGLLWDDLATGQPELTVDSTVLQQVQAFQNMSTRDLVSGMDQLISLVGALQRTSENINLPFMRGTAADVLDLTEHLQKWLTANTEPASAGDSVAGSPKFASLQTMLSTLKDQTGLKGAGADINVTSVSYDETNQKFHFTLGLTRDDTAGTTVADSSEDLASTGTGVTYTNNTLTDPNTNFPVGQNDLRGRIVQAGTAAGYVESNTLHSITLRVEPNAPDPTLGWVGGKPANGTAYRVQGADSLTGLVEFGDLFKATSGLANANAAVPRAEVVPRYSAELRLTLDLRQPITGAACDDPDQPGEETCPFPKENRDGTTVLVTEQPLPAERFLLQTGYQLVAGSLPVTTQVEVNAGIGFVKVELDGTLKICAVGDPANCAGDPKDAGDMLTLLLKNVGPISFPKAFETLVDNPSSLVDLTVGAQVYADLTASVPGATDLSGATVTAKIADADVTQDPAPTVTTTGFDALADFNLDTDNPKALLGQIVKALQVLADQLGTMAPDTAGPLQSALQTPIPVVGKSFKDLIAAGETGRGDSVTYGTASLTDTTKSFDNAYEGRSVRVGTAVGVVESAAGNTLVLAGPWEVKPADGTQYEFRSELEDLADQVSERPPDYLQDLLALINQRLGQAGAPIAFSTTDISGTPHLIMRLSWNRDVATSTPLTFDVSGASLVSAVGTGEASVSVDGSFGFGLAMPLGNDLSGPADPSQLLVTKDSHATLNLAADATGALAASIGPLSVSLGKVGGTGNELMEAHARYQLGIAGPTGGSGDTVALDDFVSGMVLSLNADDAKSTATCDGVGSTDALSLCSRLPVYVNGAPLGGATPAKSIIVRLPRDPVGASVTDQIADALDITKATVSSGDTNKRLEVPTELATELANALLDFDLLDGGLDGFLALVEKGLNLASAEGSLPLVGQDLQQGQAFIADLRTKLKAAMGPLATQDLTAFKVSDVEALASGELSARLGSLLGGSTPAIHFVCGAVDPCDPTASATTITGVTFAVTVQRGDVTAGCTDPAAGSSVQPCLGPSVPLDLGLPGLSFAALPGDSNKLDVDLGFRLHLKFGVDKLKGFFVVVNDEAQPEIQVGASIRLPSNMQARLAFLKVDLQNAEAGGNPNDAPLVDPTPAPLFAGTFKVDLHQKGAAACLDGSGPGCTSAGDKTIGMADLLALGEVVDASLDGAVNIHWKFLVRADESLPGIGGRFNLTWSFAVPNDPGTQGNLAVSFDQLQLDVGKFFGEILKPLIAEIKRFTSPLQPIIDTLYAPVPVLSELSQAVGGDPVSLASLAKAWNKLGSGMSFEMVERILGVIALVNKLPTDGTAIPIGHFQMKPDAVLTTHNTPDSVPSLLGTQTPAGGGDLRDEVDGNATTGENVLGDGQAGAEAGLEFTVLENPGSLFGLLLGQDVELFRFDSGWLRIGFDYSQSFGPVYAPPPVMMTIAGSASVSARIVAGFDTYGLRKAVEVGKPTAEILDSLYLVTVDGGKPLPVVVFGGRLGAGAELNLVAVKVGVQGGVFLTINLTWADPTNDGKFRFSEFLQAAVRNPLCLFNMDGILGLFLKVYVTLGISPFDVSFDFTLAEITLLDFSIKPDCEPPPPVLAGAEGTTLMIHVGSLGTGGLRGPDWVDASADEQVVVTELHDWAKSGHPFKGFAVKALGIRQEFLSSAYTGIVIDGRTHGGALEIVLSGDGNPNGSGDTLPFTKDAYIFGTPQADSISTGQGKAFIDARGGDDQVTTSDIHNGPAAVVAGGGGKDAITVGGANDWVAGDSQLTFDALAYGGVSTIKPGTVGHPTAYAEADVADDVDNIAVGRGDTEIWGGGGGDSIGVASDDPRAKTETPVLPEWKSQGVLIIAGGGSDRVSGASGNDEIYTGRAKLATGHDEEGATDHAGVINTVDTGSGNDKVYGSIRVDRVTARSLPAQTADIRGGDGDDILVGGLGTDTIFGGPANDWVVAEPADVKGSGPDKDQPGADDGYGPFWTVSLLPLPPDVSPSAKTLVGGDDKDHIVGGRGPATMYGDRYHTDQQCKLGTDPESTPPAETLFPGESPGNDRILGGPGTDKVLAGGQNDWATTVGGDDFVCGQSGDDKLQAGDGTDAVFGGSGKDQGYGDAADDKVFGNDGNDGVYGGGGNDVVEGNDGADDAFGDAGSDLVLGGTRKAGARDVGHDDVYGGAGLDLLIGDNGNRTVAADVRPAQPGVAGVVAYDLAGTDTEAGDDDMISGGDGLDVALGGLDVDVIFGNGGDDHLQGNNASDVINGNDGEDEIIGGSAEETSSGSGTGRPDGRDTISGGAGPDLVLGDNGQVTFGGASSPALGGRQFSSGHLVELLDLGSSPVAGTSGGDLVAGDAGTDVILGQGGPDRLRGNGDADYVEGGPDSDWIEGNDSADDLVGGSSTAAGSTNPGAGTLASSGQPDKGDVIWGGPDDDAAFGDNGVFLRGPSTTPTKLFDRVGSTAGDRMVPRQAVPYDLGDGVATPAAALFGADWVSGGSGVDVLWGQDGGDGLSGGAGDDYAEGNGGDDAIRGDTPLGVASDNTGFAVPSQPSPSPAWLGSGDPSAESVEGSGAAGQDDLVGGSSRQRFRDGDDQIEGNDGGDVGLGDNGTLLRVVGEDSGGFASEQVDAARYPEGVSLPSHAFKVRTHDGDAAGDNGTTRFCTELQVTCEPGHAFGDDDIWGDNGEDRLWGQDGDDEIFGENDDDDLFGELGDDRLFGGSGEDAILGDRGGVLGEYVDASDNLTFTVSFTQVPAETYVGLPVGTLDRRTDLLADTDAGQWVFDDASPAPHDGLTEGGSDQIRGGPDRDSVHAGFGDDLANGDSDGDEVFGDDGADMLWGGRGCDPLVGDTCASLDLRGEGDVWVDHVFGGTGALSGPSIEGALGADLLDWNPRGTYTPGTGCTTDPWPHTTPGGVALDPCAWFEMTDKHDSDATNSQHHHGTDWLYGGWDRDILQGNVAENGPNPGDRLLDWSGAYNLYTHCNAAYGGYNDVRQLSPSMNDWLTKLAYGSGAGRDLDDVSTPGSSAFRELAFVYHEDIKLHGSGKAYPSTPGHFDDPVSCVD